MKLSLVHRQSTAYAPFAIVGVTLLAPMLGGSTEVWSQALLSIIIGLLLLLAPPKKSLGWLPNVCFVALLLLALAAFLPSSWFPPDDRRRTLANFGIALPQTRSAQPWLTLQSSLVLVLGLAWAYYLLTCEWSRRWREWAWFSYAIGILALATVLIIAFVLKARVPLWPDVREFGFFPNRNQTSNVLGLGGIIIYAIGLQRLRENRRTWWVWLASLSLICWALIVNFSRAGIILFFAGALAWHSYWLITSSSRRLPALTLSALLFLVGILLLNGGETLARFAWKALFSPGAGRFSIYQDAFALLLRWPVLGVGLGNFPSVFSIHRQYSIADNDVIHPESDWLWTGIELGWLAPLLLLVLFIWWFRQCVPLETGTSRLMRAAAMICGCGFAIHGMFDVSGHRIGALWPALFLASTALHPNQGYRFSPVIARLFQVLGLLLACVGIWWFISALSPVTLPTSATLDRFDREISAASDRDDYSTVLDVASKALGIAPLEWSLYYKRGASEAAFFKTRPAQRDFEVARYLMPYWSELWFDEGRVWIEAREPDLAFDIWGEALQRFPHKAQVLYSDMFGVIRSDPALRDRWRKLGENDKRCLLIFLREAESMEFQIELQQLLADDRTLRVFTPDELKLLFALWYGKGDKLWLAQTLQEHPEWKKIAWRQLARAYADYQDYRQAFETADQFLPQIDNAGSSSPRESPVELALRFRNNPSDPSAGEALALALAREGKIGGALSTLRAVRDLPGSSKYLPALEGRLWAKEQDWKRAWNAVAPLVSAQE